MKRMLAILPILVMTLSNLPMAAVMAEELTCDSAEDAFEMVYGTTAFYPSHNKNWTEEVLNAYKEIHTEMTWQKSGYVEKNAVTGGKLTATKDLTIRKVTGIHDLSIIVANENSRYHAAVTLRINVLIVPN